MADQRGKLKRERSSTLPTSPAEPEQTKHRQARQYGVSHRPHASHHFHVPRHPTRDGAQQLGADIANFLAPSRSNINSVAPSRSASRQPSGEHQADGDQNAQRSEERLARPPVSWDEVEQLRTTRQDLELKLRIDLDELSKLALSGSRQVDSHLLDIQGTMAAAKTELDGLRQLARTTNDLLMHFTNDTVPGITEEYKKQISALRETYDHMEKERIGGLEQRLAAAREMAQGMKARMEKVRDNVSDTETKDAHEYRLSRQRHAVFWTVVALIAMLILVLLTPRTDLASSAKATIRSLNATVSLGNIRSIDPQPESKVEVGRLRPPRIPPEQEDPRLRIFDEL